MPVAESPSIQCLREPPGRPRDGRDPGSESAAAPGRSPAGEVYLLCRDCLHPIARPSDRISFQGRHAHTFANPHGFVFEIGCFQNAPGCGAVGQASEEFTWFPGHRWRVGVCAACLAHLGWVFIPGAGAAFFGLILDRLIEAPR